MVFHSHRRLSAVRRGVLCLSAGMLALAAFGCSNVPFVSQAATPTQVATDTAVPMPTATAIPTPLPPTPVPPPFPTRVPGPPPSPPEGSEIARGSSDRPQVALTFDCGSVPGTTAALLEVLRQYKLRVTFFITGEYADRNPELMKEIARDGHEIANHTYTHPDLTTLSDTAIRDELQRAEAAIQRATGHSSKPWMRMPFGARDNRVLAIVREAGYTSIYWSLDSGDWQADATAAGVRDKVLSNTANGYIVVEHCAAAQTAQALPAIIQGLQSKGLSIVSVSTLLGRASSITAIDGNDLLALVNKQQALAEDYVPPDLVELLGVPATRNGLRLRSIVMESLKALLAEANKQDRKLLLLSTYRSYQDQVSIYQSLVQQMGEDRANRVSAKPGHSEHQLGTTIDFTSPSVNYDLVESFAQTAEGSWLGENAYRFGFIMSYPQDKESITGYAYEPWHYRYVGAEAATAMHQQGLTLEEYLAARRAAG